MIEIIAAFVKIFAALGAIATLFTLLYKNYWSPKAKRKKKAVDNGIKAVDSGDKKKVLDAFDSLNR